MPNKRIDRINEEIHRELAELLRELKDPRVRGLVSITRVQTTPDLRYCTCHVSIYDKETEAEIIKVLKNASGHMRRELGSRLKLRYTPELIFKADASISEGSAIIGLINSLDIPADNDTEDDAEEENDD